MTMRKLFILIAPPTTDSVWSLVMASGFLTPDSERLVGPRDNLMQSAGYPKPGDIPVLNRKVFKGHRVFIREHPYVASIRRQCAHYLTGALITRMVVLSIAHPLHNVPVRELNVVLGESYSDRGATLLTVVLLIIHQNFDPYTLRNDIAMLRLYETVTYKSSMKGIVLTPPYVRESLAGKTAFVTGWGRCDNMGTELCLDRSSKYYPDERVDPMLRTVTFTLSADNYYCEGYKRHDVNLWPGMLCAGVAREEDQVTPCLGVPGGLLVVDARLLGILSWGFGCGYSYDLPLIYSDMRHFAPWVAANNRIMYNLKQSNLSALFEATKAAVLTQWLEETRNVTPIVTIRSDKNLEALPIDAHLTQLRGTVRDVRDFIKDGLFKEEKEYLYRSLRSEFAKTQTQPIKKIKLHRPKLVPFLGNETLQMDIQR